MLLTVSFSFYFLPKDEVTLSFIRNVCSASHYTRACALQHETI